MILTANYLLSILEIFNGIYSDLNRKTGCYLILVILILKVNKKIFFDKV